MMSCVFYGLTAHGRNSTCMMNNLVKTKLTGKADNMIHLHVISYQPTFVRMTHFMIHTH